jgi:hypothetical protein
VKAAKGSVRKRARPRRDGDASTRSAGMTSFLNKDLLVSAQDGSLRYALSWTKIV